MDKIKEVMALVRDYGDRCRTNDSVVGFEEAIEYKLRELLERKPLSDFQLSRLVSKTHSFDAMSFGESIALMNACRNVERAHGICNESKEM